MERTIPLTEWEAAGDRVISQDIFSQTRHGKIKDIEDHFKRGIDPDSMDKQGNTLLIVAVQNNQKVIAKLCLKHGADIDARNNAGHSALYYARLYNYEDVAEYLLRKGSTEINY